jgi:hypothetical protein
VCERPCNSSSQRPAWSCWQSCACTGLLQHTHPLAPKPVPVTSTNVQVCWANFGGKSSSSSTTRPTHAGRKDGSGGGVGATPAAAAASSGLHQQQRTVSLSTWVSGTQGTAAGSSTPEHQGLFGAAAAATGAGAAAGGGSDAAGFSPSHLPSWWTSSNTPAQAAGGNNNSKGVAALQTPSSAAAGNADKSSRQAAQPARPGAPAGEGAAGGASDSSGMQADNSRQRPVSECDAVLCLLLRSSITCIFPTGELLECPLLQPCQTLWPLPTGVILSVSGRPESSWGQQLG